MASRGGGGPPGAPPRPAVGEAPARTARWARRSREAHRREDQWLFGIVQGGVHLDLRETSARGVIGIGFPGYAGGGLSGGGAAEPPPPCERRARGRSSGSASPATRWEGSRWGSRRRLGTVSSSTSLRSSPPTAPATSWASGPPRHRVSA